MPSIMLYTSKLKQFYAGEFMYFTFNHFHPSTDEETASADIHAFLVAHLLTSINAAQNALVENVSLYTYNQTTGEDSYFSNLSGGGARAVTTGNGAPAFLTACFSWNVQGVQAGAELPLIKRSRFSLSGLLDSDYDRNTLRSDFADDFADDIAADYLAPITVGSDGFVPCVHVNPTGGAETWRIREIGSLKGVRLGTMNTRKTKL